MVGGVAVVSGAVLGGTLFTLFAWIPTILPNWAWLTTFGTWQQRLGPGLAGIGIGRQPSGIIPTVGEDLRAQNERKRAEREALAAGGPTVRRLVAPAVVADRHGSRGVGPVARRLTGPTVARWRARP